MVFMAEHNLFFFFQNHLFNHSFPSRHPILINVLAEREKRNECLKELRTQFTPSLASSTTSVATSQRSLDFIEHMYDRIPGDFIHKKAKSEMEKFDFPANDFDEKQFLAHVSQPGPDERYYYFKNNKKLYSIKENAKNLSMI